MYEGLSLKTYSPSESPTFNTITLEIRISTWTKTRGLETGKEVEMAGVLGRGGGKSRKLYLYKKFQKYLIKKNNKY